MSNPYATGRFATVTGLDHITSLTDLAGIVEQMLTDLRTHPDEWENCTLDAYLDSLAGYLRDQPTPTPQTPNQPTWQLIAHTLIAATGYE